MAMYCAQCGKGSSEESRFCANCGRPFASDSTYTTTAGAPVPLKLVRPRLGRKVAGVCQGLANQYRWDVTMVRIVMLLLAIVAFPVGLVLYGIIWLVAPEESFALPSTTSVSQS